MQGAQHACLAQHVAVPHRQDTCGSNLHDDSPLRVIGERAGVGQARGAAPQGPDVLDAERRQAIDQRAVVNVGRS